VRPRETKTHRPEGYINVRSRYNVIAHRLRTQSETFNPRRSSLFATRRLIGTIYPDAIRMRNNWDYLRERVINYRQLLRVRNARSVLSSLPFTIRDPPIPSRFPTEERKKERNGIFFFRVTRGMGAAVMHPPRLIIGSQNCALNGFINCQVIVRTRTSEHYRLRAIMEDELKGERAASSNVQR
jgi:hypothetical protein